MIGLSSMYISLFENTIENFIDDLKINANSISLAEIVDFRTTTLDNDFTIAALKKVKEVKLTVHCPFEAASDISNPKDELRKLALAKIKLSIDHAADIGAIGFVQHPGSKIFAYDKNSKALNGDAMLQIIDYGNSRGIKVGIENMPPNVGFMSSPEEFTEFIKDNNLNLHMVFDTGHANLAGNIDDFVKQYGSEFMQLHVTDNDAKSDGHLNVGDGTINWKKLINELRRNGFYGAYVIESATDPFKSIESLQKLLK
ncbi:MAG: sugar phosphate isomerase/epimerase family protein [Nitrososphaerales archaeon]